MQQSFTYNDGSSSGTSMTEQGHYSSGQAYKEIRCTPSSSDEDYIFVIKVVLVTQGDFAVDDEAYLYTNGTLAATLSYSNFQRHNNPGSTSSQGTSNSLYEECNY